MEEVLLSRQYQFMNLSLGPDRSIEDDDVHAWTAVIDSLLSDGETLLTVAVGNNGERDQALGFNRVQVPADCVNALAVGASNRTDKNWSRASYSARGPGRNPGRRKPDVMAFGGSAKEYFHVAVPGARPELSATMGTSFAAPYVLRTAVGIRAVLGEAVVPLTVKALIVHAAESPELEASADPLDIGWGRVPQDLNDIIMCGDGVARIIYQGCQSAEGPIALELIATDKQQISKPVLFEMDPRQDIWLDGRGAVILQRWLAARYHRAAFPEAFEDRLRAANIPGKRTLLKKLENILAVGGEHIRALLFDLDDGKDVERDSPSDLYQLGIIVLYDSLQDEPTAAAAATKAAEELEELFDAAFHSLDAGWQNICLKYCDPISDSAITVAEREMLKQWRLEHMSVQDDSPQPMITY